MAFLVWKEAGGRLCLLHNPEGLMAIETNDNEEINIAVDKSGEIITNDMRTEEPPPTIYQVVSSL